MATAQVDIQAEVSFHATVTILDQE
jgi:hypothetical protein